MQPETAVHTLRLFPVSTQYVLNEVQVSQSKLIVDKIHQQRRKRTLWTLGNLSNVC